MRSWLRIAASVSIVALVPCLAAAAEKAPPRSPAAKTPISKGRGGKSAAPAKAPAGKESPPAEAATAEGDGQALRRGERVEFDARLIQGQTAKAGAVYLFERVSSDLSSMVQERRSYRSEIVEEVFPQESSR